MGLVASFGFHSLGVISYKQHRLFKKSKSKFLEAYLAHCRSAEVELLERALDSLARCDKKVWLLSVVTKQDLWAQDRMAEGFYATGDYGRRIAAFLAARPRARHELVSCCLLIRNFVTGQGEDLAKTVAGYDHVAYLGSIRRLLKCLSSLQAWEAET